MESKKLEQVIQISNETYLQVSQVRIGINDISIRSTLSAESNERYEELTGSAEFLNYDRLVVITKDGSRSISQSKLNLTIRKAENDIKDSAMQNLKQYLGDIENLEEYGLNECVNAGFSHLTYLENIFNYDKGIECILILANEVYDELVEQIKSQTITTAMLEINYFNIFNLVKTKENKEWFEFSNAEKEIYILAREKDGDNDLFASTFGFIETLIVDTHKNYVSKKLNEIVNENDEPREYEHILLNHITAIRTIIVLGLFVIILLLIINAFLIS